MSNTITRRSSTDLLQRAEGVIQLPATIKTCRGPKSLIQLQTGGEIMTLLMISQANRITESQANWTADFSNKEVVTDTVRLRGEGARSSSSQLISGQLQQ